MCVRVCACTIITLRTLRTPIIPFAGIVANAFIGYFALYALLITTFAHGTPAHHVIYSSAAECNVTLYASYAGAVFTGFALYQVHFALLNACGCFVLCVV